MLNLPNRLTILRILMAPVIVILVVYRMPAWALAAFCVAALTDALDGFIARTRGQRTELGRILDPLADKLLLTSAFVALAALGEVRRWLAIIVVSRDLILVGGSLLTYVLLGKLTVSPSPLGKATTGLQLALVIAAVLDDLWVGAARGLPLLTWATAAATVLSGLDYVVRGSRALAGEA